MRRKGPSKLVPVRLVSYRPGASTVASSASSNGGEPDARPLRIRPRARLVAAPLSGLRTPPLVEPDGFRLTLPVPPSINHQYATVHGRRVMTAAGRAYKAEVGHLIMVALSGAVHRHRLLERLRSSSLTLTIQFHFASALRRDVDGGLKIAQDAVCGALGVNDNRIVEIHLFKRQDRERPRIELSLSSISQTEDR